MNNMRSYSLAFYPETKKKLEKIKDEKGMTWDELFNYLMRVEKSEKPKQKAQKGVNHDRVGKHEMAYGTDRH